MKDCLALPFSGRTRISRHHSARAAQKAASTRMTKTMAYLALLSEAGESGLSDHDTVRLTGWPMSSVTSIRNGAVDAGLVLPAAQHGLSPFNNKVTKWKRRG